MPVNEIILPHFQAVAFVNESFKDTKCHQQERAKKCWTQKTGWFWLFSLNRDFMLELLMLIREHAVQLCCHEFVDMMMCHLFLCADAPVPFFCKPC